MKNLVSYKTMPAWDANSLPKVFRQRHNTKVGTWGKLTIFSGQLKYYEVDEDDNILSQTTLSPDGPTFYIEPQACHKVEPITDDLKCQLSFHCEPQNYYHKKYKISQTHSEMPELLKYIDTGNALDLGCGQGRNSLFLQQQGFHVDSVDANPDAIAKLREIIAEEKLENITPRIDDANLANITQSYDTIIATVVLMFLQRERHSAIIANMQNQTRHGGYHLIICALDTPDYPCANTLPFKSPMQAGELKDYYKDWTIKKYNENIGHLHRTDADGNLIALRFATLIAQKN